MISTGSTVAVQKEDDRLWTHDTITEHGDSDHNGRSYKMQITEGQNSDSECKTQNGDTIISRTMPTRPSSKAK